MTDVAIRPAHAQDADAIAVVHSAAWQAAFTFLPAWFLEAMTPAAVVDSHRDNLADPTASLFVAVSDHHVVGFLRFRADGKQGEVMSLYVHPSTWSQGVGSTLLGFAEDSLRAEGVEMAMLWTAKESQQSRGFYEHRGWAFSGNDQTQSLPGNVALHEVEYTKRLV